MKELEMLMPNACGTSSDNRSFKFISSVLLFLFDGKNRLTFLSRDKSGLMFFFLRAPRCRGADRESERKRSRSRSRSRDRDGETNLKRRRKRPSRWSDRPPSPDRGNDNNRSNDKEQQDEENRWRDRHVDRPPADEPVVGDIYNGKISSIMQFGCFVQLEGLRFVRKKDFSSDYNVFLVFASCF